GGVDIYPISYPPGIHSDQPNKDISVVGDVTQWIRRAAGTKPVWVTLQIAWSGAIPTKQKPDVVPRFPSNAELRFMAYQAIANGATLGADRDRNPPDGRVPLRVRRLTRRHNLANRRRGPTGSGQRRRCAVRVRPGPAARALRPREPEVPVDRGDGRCIPRLVR